MTVTHVQKRSGAGYADLSFGKMDLAMVAVVFLQSLLIAWFLFLMLGNVDIPPIERFIQGLAIIFAILVPVFIVLDGFQYMAITDCFFVPLVLYAIMFALFNSLIRHLNLFLDPAIMMPAIIGGVGFGLIGLAAYHMRNNLVKTFVMATAGITIIFLSAPMILATFLHVITG
jgi:hypothetical protein